MNLGRLKNKFTNFIYTDWYLLFVLAVVFLGWQFQLEYVGLGILAITLSLILCFGDEDVTPIVPIAFMAAFIMPVNASQDYLDTGIVYYAVLVALVLFSCVYYFLRIKRFEFGIQTIGFVALSVALLLGGLFYDVNVWLKGLPYVLTIVAVLTLVYAFMFNGVNKVNKIYFAKIFMYCGILMVLQTSSFYFTAEESFDVLIKTKAINLGWGISNNIGAVLLLCMPLTLYLVVSDGKRLALYLIVFALEVVTLVLSLSRGSVLAAGIGLPVMFVFTCIWSKHRKTMFLVLCACVVMLVGLAVAYWNDILNIFEKLAIFANGGIASSGRFKLYEQAFSDFLKSPLFGIGIANGFQADGFNFFWYHNTFLQYLANAGLVGVVAYVIHLFLKYRVFFVKNAPKFNWFAFCGVAMWSFYGLLDCNYFLQYQLIMFVTLLVFVEKSLPQKPNLLPKFLRRKNNG